MPSGRHFARIDQTALREVREETGLVATMVTKLGDIKYVYVRSWGDGQRVFKIVSFFLLRYESGEIDDVSAEMRVEVKRALWIPLDEAPRKLAYRGERDMVRRAQQYLQTHNLSPQIIICLTANNRSSIYRHTYLEIRFEV